MTRPIGPYQHPHQGRLHKGHYRRIENYLRGGLTPTEAARLVGADRGWISVIRKKRGWFAANTTSAHGRG